MIAIRLSARGPRAALATAGVAALATLGACQLDKASGVDPALSKGSGSGTTDTTRASIKLMVTAGSSTFNIGPHKLVFGNNLASICDPSKSTYGPTEWEKPCTPAASAITISVKTWYDNYGHPQIDFSPALRFVPTTDATKQVTLYLKDKQEAARLVGRQVLYCAKFSGKTTSCLDESAADPSVATYLDASGFLVRKLKHFSGYNVAARDDDPYLY